MKKQFSDEKCGICGFPLGKFKKVMKILNSGDPRPSRGKGPARPEVFAREGNLDNLGLIRYIALVPDLVGLVD